MLKAIILVVLIMRVDPVPRTERFQIRDQIVEALASQSDLTDVAARTRQSPEELARLGRIALAVHLEAPLVAADSRLSARELAAATLTVWRGESDLAADIHGGAPGKHGSDNGRARCLGQVHSSGLVPPEEWRTLAGTDLAATRRCAAATMRVLSAMATMCGYTAAEGALRASRVAMFSAYATGRGCRAVAVGVERARRMGVLEWRLR